MRIIVFATENVFQKGGGATVAMNLLKQLSTTQHKVVLLVRCNYHIPENIASLHLSIKRIPYSSSIVGKVLMDLFIAPILVAFFRPNWTLCLNSLVPLLCVGRVATFFQMRMYHFEEYDDIKKKIKNRLGVLSLRRASAIFVASDDHRSDLISHMPSLSKKVYTAHLGFDFEAAENARRGVLETHGSIDSSRPFWSFASVFRPYKNLDGLIDAYGLAKQQMGQLPKLVIIGDYPTGYRFIEEYQQNVQELLLKHDLGTDVCMLGFLSHAETLSIVASSSLFLFPTKFEGFGLPVLEAMALGVPVLASNVRSIPEVGGSTIEYLDPFNRRGMAEKMVEIAQNGYRKDLLAARKRAASFTWTKTAKTVLRVLASNGRVSWRQF